MTTEFSIILGERWLKMFYIITFLKCALTYYLSFKFRLNLKGSGYIFFQFMRKLRAVNRVNN